MINVFALGTDREEPSYSLLGHSENVCALDARPSGVILSGSWDKLGLATFQSSCGGLICCRLEQLECGKNSSLSMSCVAMSKLYGLSWP